MEFHDKMPVTVSQFEYNPIEWLKHPGIWLDQYVCHRNLPKYEVYYRDCEYTDIGGYHAILILGDRSFLTPGYYSSTDTAKTNAVILTLLNIAGYCETANELQGKLINLLHTEGSPKPFATRKNLTRSLDSYSDEPNISPSEIKEKVVATLRDYDLDINFIKNRSIMAILKDDYNIRVSKRSIQIACGEIRHDRARRSHGISTATGVQQ